MPMIQGETASDGDLAVLALKVAQQVDRKLAGKALDEGVFAAFRKGLAQVAGGETSQPASFLHSDPATTEIFAQAINETSSHQVSDVTELRDALGGIVASLGNDSSNKATNDLSVIKAFCLSLHRSIMSQKLPPLPEVEGHFDDDLGLIR